MDDIQTYEKLLKEQKTPKGFFLSEVSVKGYVQKINKLVKQGYDSIWLDPELLLERLNKDYDKLISRKANLMAIIKYMKTTKTGNPVLLKKLNDYYMTMSNDYVSQKDKNNKTETENDNWIEYQELLKYKNRIKNDTQFLALFKIYTEIPPVRNDVYNIKFKNYNQETENYFDKENNVIVINEYKESKSYGKVVLDLNKTLVNNLKSLCKNSTDDYVFHNTSGNPFVDSKAFSVYFTSKFKSLTGKNIGTTMLRKIYISYFNEQNPTLEERKRVAHIMGHSVNTGLTYDRKSEDKKSEDKKSEDKKSEYKKSEDRKSENKNSEDKK